VEEQGKKIWRYPNTRREHVTTTTVRRRGRGKISETLFSYKAIKRRNEGVEEGFD